MQSVLISLTNHDRERARKWSDAVLRNIPKYANHTGLEAPNRYYVGYLGEIGVAKWLEENRAIFMHRVRTNGRSQRSEITADVMNKTVELEVKTASSPRRRDYLQPETQKTDAAYYFGVRLHDDEAAEIMGWMTQGMLLSLPIEIGPYCKHRITPYSQLCDMAEFAAMLYPVMPERSFELWRARVDLSQLGGGVPDLLVSCRACTWLVEVKDGKKRPSARVLTAAQRQFHDQWPGYIAIVEDVERVPDVILNACHNDYNAIA